MTRDTALTLWTPTQLPRCLSQELEHAGVDLEAGTVRGGAMSAALTPDGLLLLDFSFESSDAGGPDLQGVFVTARLTGCSYVVVHQSRDDVYYEGRCFDAAVRREREFAASLDGSTIVFKPPSARSAPAGDLEPQPTGGAQRLRAALHARTFSQPIHQASITIGATCLTCEPVGCCLCSVD